MKFFSFFVLPLALGSVALAADGPTLDLNVGHSGGVEGVLFNRDGTLLLSAGNDLTVRRWDVASGTETTRLYGAWNNAITWAATPDGSRFVIAYKDGSLRTFHLAAPGTAPRSLSFLPAQDKETEIRALAVSPSGKLVAGLACRPIKTEKPADPRRLGSGPAIPQGENRFKIWNIATGEVAGEFSWTGPEAGRLTFNADESGVWVADAGGQVNEHTLKGEVLDATQLPRNGVLSANVAALSPDGTLALGDTFSVFETHHGQPRARLATSQMRPGRLEFGAFSNDNKLVVGITDIARAWRMSNPKEMYSIFLREDPVTSFALAQTGTVFATGHKSSAIVLRDAESGEISRSLQGGPEIWDSVGWLGQDIISRVNGTIYRWNGKSGALGKGWQEDAAEVTAVAQSPDGTLQAVAVYGPPSGEAPAQGEGGDGAAPPAQAPLPAEGEEFPDNNAQGGGQTTRQLPPPPEPVAQLKMIEVATGNVLWTRMDESTGTKIGHLAFTPDGSAVVAGGERVLSAESGSAPANPRIGPQRRPNENDGAQTQIEGIAFRGINALNSQTGEKADLFFLQGSQFGDVKQLFIARDGGHVAATGDTRVYGWEMPLGKSVLQGAVTGTKEGMAALSPDGKFLAVAQTPGITIWAMGTDGKPGNALRMRTAQRITGVAYNGKGELLAVDESGAIYRTGGAAPAAEVLEPVTPGDGFAVNGLAASPDGRLIAGAGTDGRIRVWDGSGKLRLTLVKLPAVAQTPRAGSKPAARPAGRPAAKQATDSWIAYTPSGQFHGSTDAEQFVVWREGNSVTENPEKTKTMRQAAEVARALAG